MTISDPAPREHLHTRSVICQGYAREDGLWDIEGRLRDEKTYDFLNRWRGDVAAGMPVHEMIVRLTLNDRMVVQDIEVAMPAAPFTGCSSVEPDFKILIGEQIGAGWNRTVRALVGGTKGCTHVSEILGRIAMTAYQTIPVERYRRAKRLASLDPSTAEKLESGGKKKPFFLDGCHTWAADSDVVKQEFPLFYTGGDGDNGDGS